MAHHTTTHGADNDYREHEATYARFLTMTKWGTIAVALLLMFIGSMTSLIPWALTLIVMVVGLAAASIL